MTDKPQVIVIELAPHRRRRTEHALLAVLSIGLLIWTWMEYVAPPLAAYVGDLLEADHANHPAADENGGKPVARDA